MEADRVKAEGVSVVPARALIVDEDEATTTSLRRALLRMNGCRSVETAATGIQALDLLARSSYDLVLVDVRPDGDWREVLSTTESSEEPPAVMMISRHADIPLVVDAIRRGAADFLLKPIDIDELFARIDRSLAHVRARRNLGSPRPGARPIFGPTQVGTAMAKTLALADRVAATPASSALIVGESGVGKEILAARIHERSARREGPFVRVNVAAISETVIEAELFGSVRGAFTDAKRDRAGHLASADAGTILLDEIGEFRPEHQPKLLRALEERRFYPVGSDRERLVDVRFLAATNRNPEELVTSKMLRPDLYYRLGTVIRIPPLRERTSEILPLATQFIELYCKEFRRSLCTLDPHAAERLIEYAWPGNIRELRNVIEHSVMMCEGDVITLEQVMASTRDWGAPPMPISASLRLEDARLQTLDQVERDHIIRVLSIAVDSKSRAAEMLGVSRSTLYDKMKRYGIE
jgi:two-component system, NtrC family, response regulator AtoC